MGISGKTSFTTSLLPGKFYGGKFQLIAWVACSNLLSGKSIWCLKGQLFQE